MAHGVTLKNIYNEHYKKMNKNLYFIDLNLPYLENLAFGIVERFDDKARPFAELLLPSERAVLNFQKIFVKNFKTATLPKLSTIGSFCEKLSKRDGETYKTISSLDRFDFILNTLKTLLQKNSIDHLKTLSFEIIRLFDEIILSGSSKLDLVNLLKNEHHLNKQNEILLHVTEKYGDYLHQNNMLDEKEALEKKCYKAISLLQEGFNNPIILGGTTGTIPFVQDLSKTLLNSKNGYVILPGLDDIKDDYNIYHPFYTQSQWMKAVDIEKNPEPFVERNIAFDVKPIFQNKISQKIACDHIIPFDVKTPFYEARLIATLVRHHLQMGDLNITIVCNDTNLTNQIQDALKHYGFMANNSLGTNINQTVAGKFLRVFLSAITKQDLKSLITLLKHPLYASENRFDHLNALERFEEKLQEETLQGIESIFSLFSDLNIIKKYKTLPTRQFATKWLNLIIEDIKILSNDKIFLKQDGQTLSEFFKTLEPLFLKLKSLTFFDFIEHLNAYLDHAPTISDYENLHQNVTLIGTIEARHNTADVMIVAALNEGQWPTPLKPNLWLNQHQQKTLNLPEAERRLGLSSHDFSACLTAKNVYLTRSLKVEGIPTQMNRWLKRLSLHLDLKPDQIEKRDWFLNITKQLIEGDVKSLKDTPLKTYPTGFEKPKELSISAIELLNKDPYQYYLRYILKLKERYEWYLGLSPSQIGQLVHHLLEIIDLFDDSDHEKHINTILQNQGLASHHEMFLRKNLKEMLSFVLNDIKENVPSDTLREEKLSFMFKDILIFGIADRLDFINKKFARLIDYKTGTPPPFSAIKKGLSLQMPLLYKMCETQYGPLDNSIFDYMALKGYKNQSKIITLPLDQSIIDQTVMIVEKLISYYFDEGNAFKEV